MRHLAVCLLCLAVAARAEPPAIAPAAAPVPAQWDAEPAMEQKSEAPAPLSLRARLGEETIRKAVKDTLTDADDYPQLYQGDTLSGAAYEQFGREFHEAKVPDCLHPDGLKRQPTFFLGGLLALPFVAVAKIRGKCR
ncbi:MAG: hypothetical protein AB1584_01635 [Pseudomonadota bacterium]